LFYSLFKVRGREPKENYFRGDVMEKRIRTTALQHQQFEVYKN